MRSRIRNKDSEPGDDEGDEEKDKGHVDDGNHLYEDDHMRMIMGTTCMRLMMRMMMRSTTCMRMIGITCMRMMSHQRLPKPRLEIRAEQNGDGGVGVSKSDDHLCQ